MSIAQQAGPPRQSPPGTLQNEQSFAAKRDAALMAGSSAGAACIAIEVAQATEPRIVIAEEQRDHSQMLAQQLNADLNNLNHMQPPRNIHQQT